MDQRNPNSQEPNQMIEPDWFSQVPGEPLPQNRPPHSRRKSLIIVFVIFCIAAILVVGIAAVLYMTNERCLTKDDYQAVFKKNYSDELSPTENFYTGSVYFVEKSSRL